VFNPAAKDYLLVTGKPDTVDARRPAKGGRDRQENTMRLRIAPATGLVSFGRRRPAAIEA
jgi:hypothetical protein